MTVAIVDTYVYAGLVHGTFHCRYRGNSAGARRRWRVALIPVCSMDKMIRDHKRVDVENHRVNNHTRECTRWSKYSTVGFVVGMMAVGPVSSRMDTTIY